MSDVFSGRICLHPSERRLPRAQQVAFALAQSIAEEQAHVSELLANAPPFSQSLPISGQMPSPPVTPVVATEPIIAEQPRVNQVKI